MASGNGRVVGKMLVFATGNGSGEGLALRGFFCLVGRLGLGDG